MNLEPKDFITETFCDPSKYSAWVTNPKVSVRITHTPTGKFAECMEYRSVHKNRDVAWNLLLKELT